MYRREIHLDFEPVNRVSTSLKQRAPVASEMDLTPNIFVLKVQVILEKNGVFCMMPGIQVRYYDGTGLI